MLGPVRIVHVVALTMVIGATHLELTALVLGKLDVGSTVHGWNVVVVGEGRIVGVDAFGGSVYGAIRSEAL